MLTKLTISNQTLKNIIEYDSSGIIYWIDNKIMGYNKALLNMFEIRTTDNHERVSQCIKKMIAQVEQQIQYNEIEGTELVLSINNEKKSFIVTMKQLF